MYDTLFRICLLDDTLLPDMQSPPTPLQLALETRSPLNLLIVENVVEDVELITLALENASISFQYDHADTVEECEQLLIQNRYDAVLSDYRLTSWNAYRAFELLQEFDQDIPFILVTGSLGEEAAVECLRAGMTDFILKDRLFRLPDVLDRALQEFELRRQQRLAIAELKQQAYREAIINRIIQAMRGTLVLDQVLQATTDHLHEALEANRCFIFQFDDHQLITIKHLSIKTLDRELFLDTTCPFATQYHEMLRAGEQVYLQHFHITPQQPTYKFAEFYQIKSLVLTPLIYQNSYLGGIGIHNCINPRIWNESELSLVKAIADHCAIAIHQVKLYEQLQGELEERKRIEERLRHDSLHDALTGLPNRTLLMDRLEQALRRVQTRHHRQATYQYRFAILFLDLDHFKVINDSLGHLIGDVLLKQVSQRLKSSLRMGDTVARLGGDEFVFLIENISDIQDAIEVVSRVHTLFQKPFQLENHEIFVNVSIGVAISSTHYQNPSQILRDADTAMYSAKEQGRSCFAVFDHSMHQQAMRRLNLENSLRKAIENHEFQVYYQPIFCLRKKQIRSFEALVRWQHPTQGLLLPSEFITTAEETGLIVEIDLLACREACSQLIHWRSQFHNYQLSRSI